MKVMAMKSSYCVMSKGSRILSAIIQKEADKFQGSRVLK